MKRFNLYYTILGTVTLSCLYILSLILFPEKSTVKVVLWMSIPLMILALGFRIITNYRIKLIRDQLFQILQTLEAFDIDQPKQVKFKASPFPIFNDLNKYLIELIDRININYQANKQFTQNASHELQTPLAVIKGHIELLLQSPHLGEKEMESLGIVLQNTNRLSKINSALILLSKIEHQRFSDTEVVDFVKVIEEALYNFNDLIRIQGIKLNRYLQHPFYFEMSHTLAEILIANLIQNAIRYNQENGFIQIRISKNKVSISNPGEKLKVSSKVLFKRFHRTSEVEESLGLGLAIVERICKQSNLAIEYNYSEGLHVFSLVAKES